jgi:hypothetical protein
MERRRFRPPKNKKNSCLAGDVTLQLHGWDLKVYEYNLSFYHRSCMCIYSLPICIHRYSIYEASPAPQRPSVQRVMMIVS